MVGCDSSIGLLEIAGGQERGYKPVVLCDGLNVPFKDFQFDFAISIAVIHHFSTHERRKEGIKEVLRVCKVNGKALIFVWAFEQSGKRQYDQQDVMVPWKSNVKGNDTVYQRYYHLFKKDELEGLIQELNHDHEVNCVIEEAGFDSDNWWIIVKRIK